MEADPTTDTTGDARLRELEALPLTELRDRALARARERRDVGFLWDLSKHLPDTYEANRDWAVYDPVDAVRELIHLVTHFREEAANPEVAELLRARYVDYLSRP